MTTKVQDEEKLLLLTGEELSPQQLLEELEKVETRPEPEPFLTTPEVLGLRTLGSDGLVAHNNGHYSIVRRLDSVDAKMMSGTEKNSIVTFGADFLSSLTRPVSFYTIVEPRNMQFFLSDLARKRQKEPNPQMRQNHFIEEDHIKSLETSSNLTERTSYIAFSATKAELKSIALTGTAPDGEREEISDEAAGKATVFDTFVEFIKRRWREISDVGEDEKGGKVKTFTDPTRGSSFIPPVIAEGLKFTAASTADAMSRMGMGSHSIPENGLANHLSRRLSSPFANYPGTPKEVRERNKKVIPLERVGGAGFFEASQFVRFRNPETGEKRYAATLYLTGFPRLLSLAALFELLRITDIPMQVAVHVTPWDTLRAQKKLKSREQIIWAYTQNNNSVAGDLEADYRKESIRELRKKLARGEGKIFRVGVRISIIAASSGRLKNDLRRIAQRMQELGYQVAVATRNQRRAFPSTLPTGRDYLSEGRFFADRTQHTNMTGESVMCLLPNIIPDSTQSGGIILGVNRTDGSLVTFNRWKLVSPHTVVIATTGGGKTVAMLAEALQELMHDHELQIFFIDPQGVMIKAAELVDGTVIDLGPKGNAIINPMDKYVLNGLPEELSERLLFLYPLFEMMLKATITAGDRTAIKNALERLYYHFEQGESIVHLLEASFSSQRIFAACRPYLKDWKDEEGKLHQGIIPRLHSIYQELTLKHKIPSSGLVSGTKEYEQVVTGVTEKETQPSDSLPSANHKSHIKRPMCAFSSEDSRYYYRGEGETFEPLPEGVFEPKRKYGAIPPLVFYPEPDWYLALFTDFSNRVQEPDEYGLEVFWMLDKTAKKPAIRDAFVELKRGMPVLSDLMPLLAAEGLSTLVDSLDTFVSPNGFGKMFNGFTNVSLDKRFISFNVRDLDQDYLRPIRIFQVVNFTWGITRAIKRPRLFTVDEFGLLIKSFTDVGRYVSDLFMRGRAFYLSMTAIVQNITNLIDYEYGLICMENAERTILLRQQEIAVDRLVSRLRITAGQVAYLLRAKNGESLQRIDGRWVSVKYDVPAPHLKAFDTRPQAQRLATVGNEDD